MSLTVEPLLTASENHRGYAIRDFVGYRVATVQPCDEDGKQGGEYARLFAAAPDLLEVARCIENALIAGFKPAEILDENSPIRDGLRAAIAKATGQKEGG